MAFEIRPGQGTFHRNKQKDEGSSQPDYRGDLNIAGVMYELGGWLKDGKSGKWMSLSVKPKEQREQAPAKPSAPAPSDEIPF